MEWVVIAFIICVSGLAGAAIYAIQQAYEHALEEIARAWREKAPSAEEFRKLIHDEAQRLADAMRNMGGGRPLRKP